MSNTKRAGKRSNGHQRGGSWTCLCCPDMKPISAAVMDFVRANKDLLVEGGIGVRQPDGDIGFPHPDDLGFKVGDECLSLEEMLRRWPGLGLVKRDGVVKFSMNKEGVAA